MRLSEISIQRSVLATMMSVALVLFGVVALTRLPVRELPDVDAPVVNVSTVYPGANANVVETLSHHYVLSRSGRPGCNASVPSGRLRF